MRRRPRNKSSETLQLGFYALYLITFVVIWIFAIIKFKENRTTALFYGGMGILMVVIVALDILFKSKKYYNDIPINTFNFFENFSWKIDLTLFFVLLTILLIFTKFTGTLVYPVPFSVSANQIARVDNSVLTQAFYTSAVSPIETALFTAFPVCTLATVGAFWLGKKNGRSSRTWFLIIGIISSFLMAYIAVLAHRLIYPSVMISTSLTVFIFFLIIGIISVVRRNIVAISLLHFFYNFLIVVFSLVPFAINILR
jgi:hypothetical protein